MKLSRGVPTVLLRSADEALARRLEIRLKAGGNHAVLIDTSTMVPQGRMVRVRGFRFEGAGLRRVSVDGLQDEANDPSLSYDQLSTIVRVLVESSTQTTTTTNERRFSVGRAALSGGLMMTKSKKVEQTERHHETEQLVYLFPQRGTPWLLREHGTNYQGLGTALQPSSFRNVLTFVAALRARAPVATYDESLMGPAGAAARTQAEDLDVLATAIFLGVELSAQGDA
jgi:hypothetical protein